MSNFIRCNESQNHSKQKKEMRRKVKKETRRGRISKKTKASAVKVNINLPRESIS
jgi:hypothetical protein